MSSEVLRWQVEEIVIMISSETFPLDREEVQGADTRRNPLVTEAICREEGSFPCPNCPRWSPSMFCSKERVAGSSGPSKEMVSQLPADSWSLSPMRRGARQGPGSYGMGPQRGDCCQSHCTSSTIYLLWPSWGTFSRSEQPVVLQITIYWVYLGIHFSSPRQV